MSAALGLRAPAKINLALHVTGQRDDGYHLLDSVVMFADVGDRLEFVPGPQLQLAVQGPFAHGVPTDHRNLVWKAAELAGWTGDIRLTKNLPHGGGIGGGSSDAAALLRAVAPHVDGAVLGADVPVCQFGSAVRMRGIGGHLDPISPAPELAALLVTPGVAVPTAEVFRRLTRKNNSALSPLPTTSDPNVWFDWLTTQRNDLEAPAIDYAPVIQKTLSAIRQSPGCRLARMSGSGSTCFGLYDTRREADEAGAMIRAANRDWWVAPCRLR